MYYKTIITVVHSYDGAPISVFCNNEAVKVHVTQVELLDLGTAGARDPHFQAWLKSIGGQSREKGNDIEVVILTSCNTVKKVYSNAADNAAINISSCNIPGKNDLRKIYRENPLWRECKVAQYRDVRDAKANAMMQKMAVYGWSCELEDGEIIATHAFSCSDDEFEISIPGPDYLGALKDSYENEFSINAFVKAALDENPEEDIAVLLEEANEARSLLGGLVSFLSSPEVQAENHPITKTLDFWAHLRTSFTSEEYAEIMSGSEAGKEILYNKIIRGMVVPYGDAILPSQTDSKDAWGVSEQILFKNMEDVSPWTIDEDEE